MLFLSAAILHVLSLEALAKAGVKSFCTAKPAKVDEEALIFCHFDTDINTAQKDVLVYVFKGNKQQPVLILAWYDGKPNFSTEPGYQCDGRISDIIIIKIPKAKPDQAGEYQCIVTLNPTGDVQRCTLNILGIKNDSLLTTFPTKHAKDTKGTNEYLIVIILGVALGVATIILVVVLAVRKRWIRFPCKREEQQRKHHCYKLNRKKENAQ